MIQICYFRPYLDTVFFMLKYFMKYFGDNSVFNEILQNSMSLFVSAKSGHGTKFSDVKYILYM